MRKLLGVSLAGVLMAPLLAGCGGRGTTAASAGNQDSPLADLPFVYKMTVQQGNILTPEMVDRLEIGMTQRQVRFLLGTPPLTDFFNANRWDYTYTIRRGHAPIEIRNLVLHFEGDLLARIEGDVKPDPARRQNEPPREIVVTVPDYEGKPGLMGRSLRAVGLEPKD